MGPGGNELEATSVIPPRIRGRDLLPKDSPQRQEVLLTVAAQRGCQGGWHGHPGSSSGEMAFSPLYLSSVSADSGQNVARPG